MKRAYLIFVSDEYEAEVNIRAISKECAGIYIEAATPEEAFALIPQGEEMAERAMQDFVPAEPAPAAPEEEKPKTGKRHYFMPGMTLEEMQADAAEYEKTAKGSRFVKRIDNARKFYFKHSKSGGLIISELGYLYAKHEGSLINGCGDITALAYRRGYMNGKAASQKVH